MSSDTAKTVNRASAWRTSSASGGVGSCVEVAPTGGRILVRDSKNRVPGQVLSFAVPGWRTLVTRL